MARGRRKGLTKKLVREVKYNPPTVDFEGLEAELTLEEDTGYASKTSDDTDTDLHDLSEAELEEYFNWASQAAKKKTGNKLEHVND